jgi:hypothetical protein
MKKEFREELIKIKRKIELRDKFAFSKFADGEYAILKNETITNTDNWTYKKDEDKFYSDQLKYALQFKHEDYIVGISATSNNKKHHQYLMAYSKQPLSNLTFADLFVNSNHQYFIDEVVPLFSNYDVVLVCNKNNSIENLPFKVYKKFDIGDLAWKEDYEKIFEINHWIKKEEIKNKLFLFCAGPLGNMLSHRLFERCKENTYLDVGSSLNNYFNLKNRRYLYNEKFRNSTPKW